MTFQAVSRGKAAKTIKLEKSVTGILPDELRAVFGTREGAKRGDAAALMRSLILNARDFPADDETRSLRGFWYKYIKPALSALGYLEKRDGKEDPSRYYSQQLSETITELAEKIELQYLRDLHISDGSRELDTPKGRDCAPSDPRVFIAGFQERGRIYPEIILAIEKDSEYGTIEGIARLLGCSSLSGKGEPALAAMEKLLLSAREVVAGRDIMILAMTDHDPDGAQIARAFGKQAALISRNLGMKGKIRMLRIGVKPEHLDPAELAVAKYELHAVPSKQKQLDAWMKETGGIDRESYGLELDALPRSEIRRLFVTGTRLLVDQDEILAEDSKRDFIAGIVSDALQPRVLEIAETLFKRYRSKVLPAGIDLFTMAEEGESFFSSREMFTTKSEKAIARAAVKALVGIGKRP